MSTNALGIPVRALLIGALLAIAGLFAIIFVASGLHTVDSTERAVVFHSDGSLTTLEPGKFQWVTPIVSTVTTYNVQFQTYTQSAVGISLDLQETTTEVTVQYGPDPSKIRTIHQELGKGYEAKIVVPAVQGCVKNAVSFYNVEQLTGSIRAKVADDISGCVGERLAAGNLIVQAVTVTDFDFSPQFNAAIEAKAIAQQRAQEEKNRLEQTVYQANQTRIQADAQAYATSVLAGATSGNQGQAYLFLEWLKVWDGVLPQYMGGDQGAALLITPPVKGA